VTDGKSSHKRPINGPGGIRGKADGPPGPTVRSPVDPYLPAPIARPSRAPLLAAEQIALLLGGGLKPAWVRRHLPGSRPLGPRRRAWPIEAVEAYFAQSFTDTALTSVGAPPYTQEAL